MLVNAVSKSLSEYAMIAVSGDPGCNAVLIITLRKKRPPEMEGAH